MSLDAYAIDRPQARFFFVDEGCYDNVKVGLSVTSFGSGSSQARVAVPVVRERDFFQAETWLMTVPDVITGDFGLSDNRKPVYRHKLRVFNSDYTDQGVVVVKVWISSGPNSGGNPDQQATVQMNKRDGNDPSFPFYGDVELENVCLHTTGIGCVYTNAIVQVTPASPNLRYWTFVSSTDNSTQQIVVTLPQ